MITLALIIAAFLGAIIGSFSAVAFIRIKPVESEEFVQRTKEAVRPRFHGKAQYVEAPSQEEMDKINGKPDFVEGLHLAPPAEEE